MKYSIVVVCLNAGVELKKTIDSILMQTWQDYEIVVKDGCSTDGSIEALPRNEKICLIQKKDDGIYDAMNQAIPETTGDYLLFLNCGDYLANENALEKIEEHIQKSKKSEIYYGNIYNRKCRSFVAANPKIDAFACYRNLPCHQACLYARELMIERGYRKEYKIRADYEHFLWSFFEKKVYPVYLDLTIASYEGGGFSETKKNLRASAYEHQKIVAKYMSTGQILKYRLILLLTLAPLRRFMAENKYMSSFYNRLKGLLYRQ